MSDLHGKVTVTTPLQYSQPFTALIYESLSRDVLPIKM